MQLSHLLLPFFALPAVAEREVLRLTLDSRKVQAGDVFFALSGGQQDGRRYISQAITQGAAAVIAEADRPEDEKLLWQDSVPVVVMYQLRQRLGTIAARFLGEPSKKLRMIGVTGTNGKTSCTHFIAQSLQALGHCCGLIGTLGHGFYGNLQNGEMTTPDAIFLQARLAELLKQGAESVAMEVSSHSLVQERVRGINFALGIFTNLTQDHLDYHITMENYAQAKKKFFTELPVEQFLINADDKTGLQWIQEFTGRKKIMAYSVRPPRAGWPDLCPLIYADQVIPSLQGIHAVVCSPWGKGELSLALIGSFNLSNALAVLAALCIYGIPFNQALEQVGQLKPVAGRMQMQGGEKGQPLVVVDYAHTPDALEQVLQALRPHAQGKLICVFGCGGDRDRGKRPLMAQIAERLADRVVVTSDNPRNEDPDAIAREIMSGFLHPEHVTVLLDRSHAIQNSIQLATGKDCILIAGKGAERYQQTGGVKIPFDDMEQVKSFLSGESSCFCG